MKWIDIQEKLPPQNAYVLVAKFYKSKGTEMYFIEIASRLGIAWYDGYNGDELKPKDGIVTHWMPLPDDPLKAIKVAE